MGEKLSFEVDAGVILAKLHRGACELYANNGITFINTGMINDADITPEKMKSDGKITFDLEAGEYELGVIIDKANTLPVKHSVEDIKAKQDEAGEDEDAKKGITDKLSKDEKDAALSDDEKEKELDEDVASQITPGNALMHVLDNAESQAIEKATADITKKTENLGDEVKKMIKDDADAIKKHMQDYMRNAEEYLKNYMTVFGGSEQADKIDVKKIAVTFVPDKFANPLNVKKWKSQKYQIPALSDKEVREMKIEQLKKKPGAGDIQLKNMCYKISYQLNLGK